MLKDFQTENRFRDHYDCCVIGGGPAGITIALRLAAEGKRVVLVEGGDVEYSERSQLLYQCRSTGREAYADTKRQRMLGGTSNHWAGRCRPMEPSDFTSALPNGMSGWPISYAEIDRYQLEAMRILDLPVKEFATLTPPLSGGDFNADRYMFSTTRFASKYAKDLRETPNLDVFVNCNCVDLIFDGKTKRLATATVVDYSGRKQGIKAKCFVLAMGAIENARQLLSSNSLAAHGVIKEGDLTGSCFMEHLLVDIGNFVLNEDQSTDERQYYTSDAFVDKHRVGKGNLRFSNITKIKSYGRTAAVKSFFKNLSCSMGIAEKVQIISRFDCPGDGTISTQIEQLPRRQSRISLTKDTDALGMRKASIHWEIGEDDVRTIRTIGMEVAKRFADSRLGYVKLNEDLMGDPSKLYIHPHAHHMGTTRMASKPGDGVVDENCKVFGTENLYVAGSSIFPRGGANNPTLPIVQFALRLADHLKQLLR
jgi:choline dehydrogenase-like flavoprotein